MAAAGWAEGINLYERAQRLADEYRIPFVSASAKTGAGVDFAFVTLLDEMVKRRHPDQLPREQRLDSPWRPREHSRRGGGRCWKCCMPAPTPRRRYAPPDPQPCTIM